MENEFKTRSDEVKEAILYLYKNRRNKKKIPSWLDYASVLSYPMEEIIDVYNNLIDEGIFSGQKIYLSKREVTNVLASGMSKARIASESA